MLVLKLTHDNLTTRNGFQWPESGPVECPDWDPKPGCGGGLHGWAGGCGSYRHSFNHGRFLVVEVADEDVVHLDDKCKFRRGTVVYCGDRAGAVRYLIDHGALTADGDPSWHALTPAQCAEVALRAADRAVRQYAPKRLRARGLIEAAERLEALPKIVDLETARKGRDAADAADAAANAANAANAAYYAAAAAANAAYYAAYYAAAAAAYAADAAAAAADHAYEREAQRRDKLELLGLTK